jgi:putative sigma-54 modulation protein
MEIIMQSVHFDADVKLQEFIEKKLSKLETFFDHIVSADVILKLENSGQVKDKIAEIKLNVPGSTLLAKETSKTFEESIDMCADALRRQLQKYKERNNGH